MSFSLPLQTKTHSHDNILALRSFVADEAQVALANLGDRCRSLVETAVYVYHFPQRDMGKQTTALVLC